MTWPDVLKLAIPMVVLLAGVIWALIVYHGDSRWLRQQVALDKDGDPKWMTRKEAEQLAADLEDTREKAADGLANATNVLTTMVLGQNDLIANHEGRLVRLEERDAMLLPPIRDALATIATKFGDVSERLARLEDVPRRLGAIETRMNERRTNPHTQE